jgi:hypothetical protein
LQALQSITSNQQRYMAIILGMLGSNTSGSAAG